MLTCYIIDDQAADVSVLADHIRKTPSLQLLETRGETLLAISSFQDTGYPDIVFVEVDMERFQGMQLPALLHRHTNVIVVTRCRSFAIEAFEYDIKDYLLKPLSYERFTQCIQKVSKLRRIPSLSEESGHEFFYVQVESKGKIVKLLCNEIIYIECQKNYLSIVTAQRKYLTYLTMGEFEDKLPPYFLRINKSFIVNTDKISYVEKSEVYLSQTGQSVPIGISYKNVFAAYMDQFLIKTKRV